MKQAVLDLNVPISKYKSGNEVKTPIRPWAHMPIIENYLNSIFIRAQNHIDKGEYLELRKMGGKCELSYEYFLEKRIDKEVTLIHSPLFYKDQRGLVKYLKVGLPELKSALSKKNFHWAWDVLKGCYVSNNLLHMLALSAKTGVESVSGASQSEDEFIRAIINPLEQNWSKRPGKASSNPISNEQLLKYFNLTLDVAVAAQENGDFVNATKFYGDAANAMSILESRLIQETFFNEELFSHAVKGMMSKYEAEDPFTYAECLLLEKILAMELFRREGKEGVPESLHGILSEAFAGYEAGDVSSGTIRIIFAGKFSDNANEGEKTLRAICDVVCDTRAGIVADVNKARASKASD